MKRLLLSIILPTLNEKENIIDLVKELDKVIKQPKEILVVDDDSPDGTAAAVRHLISSKKIPNLRLIVRKHNHGLTNSIQEGIDNAKGEFISWMDCDFSMPPKILVKLLEQVVSGKYTIAVGSRFVPGGSFKRKSKGQKESVLAIVLSRIMNYLIQFLLGLDFKDYTSGFIVARRDLFDKVRLQGDYGEYFMHLIFEAKHLGFTFVEIPYVCLPRERGYSKTGETLPILFKHGIKYIVLAGKLFLLRIKYAF